MTRVRSFVVVGVLAAACVVSSAITSAEPSTYAVSRVGGQAPKPAPHSTTVYVTKTGERCHRGSCGSLRKSRIETTVAQAKRDGFTACKVCKPPS
jgi:hypothetical protein